MTSLFCPRDYFCDKFKNNLRVMSARNGKLSQKIALHENSFDDSADAEFLSVVKEDGTYDSSEENSPLSSQMCLESRHNNTDSVNFKEISNVTYKIIQVAANEETVTNMQDSPPHGTYIVSIDEPVEVFAPTTRIKREDKIAIRSQPAHQSKASTTKKRDDKRRVTHNEVERRRRDKINTWIMKLAALVPNSGMPDSASKGGILAKACDHIMELNEKQKRLEKLEVENEKLVLEVLRLNQELSDLRKENTSVRNQLADNCTVLSAFARPKEEKS